MNNSRLKNIAIFASGSGTNTESIIQYFKTNKLINIEIILSNKKDAYVIQRAKNNNIDWFVFNKQQFYHSNDILNELKNRNIDLIVLAGFLWLIPINILSAFNERIINIHPALLPAYGGKGLYGSKVHEAVINNKEKESGISIHYVNEKYDEGKIIFQAKTQIDLKDTPETLAQKIHQLEYEHFPIIIEQIINSIE